MFEDLRRWGIKSISPEEALSMVQSGKAVLVDVREPKKFDLVCVLLCPPQWTSEHTEVVVVL